MVSQLVVKRHNLPDPSSSENGGRCPCLVDSVRIGWLGGVTCAASLAVWFVPSLPSLRNSERFAPRLGLRLGVFLRAPFGRWPAPLPLRVRVPLDEGEGQL